MPSVRRAPAASQRAGAAQQAISGSIVDSTHFDGLAAFVEIGYLGLVGALGDAAGAIDA